MNCKDTNLARLTFLGAGFILLVVLFTSTELFAEEPHSASSANRANQTLHPRNRFSAVEPPTAILSQPTNQFSFMWPVIIKGSEWPVGLNQSIKSFSLWAIRQGEFKPIPFQIDEYDETGLVYVPGVTKYAPEGQPEILDRTDELIFMFRDAGLVQYQSQNHGKLKSGTLLFELSIEQPGEPIRYVYMVQNSPLRSHQDYVVVNSKGVTLGSDYYEIKTRPDNLFHIQSIKAGPQSSHSKNIWDNLYLKLDSGFVHQNLRAALDSRDNIRARILGVVDGPVRATALVELTVRVMSVPVLSMQLNLALYEQAIRFRSRFSGNSFALAKYVTLVLREPRFFLVMDFNQLQGAQFSLDTLDARWGSPAIVDGKMSPTEDAINDLHLPGRWLWLESPEGWGFFLSNLLPFAHDGLFIHFGQGVDWELYYRDDEKSIEYDERFPGAGPRFGFVGTGLPPVILELLSALAALDFSQLETIEDLIDGLAALDKDNRLHELNAIISRELKLLKAEGGIKSNQELATAFVRDLNRVGFQGLDRAVLNMLVTEAALEIKDFTQFDAANILLNFQQKAKTAGVDLKALQYAPRDNTLWIPNGLGADDADAFYQRTIQSATYRFRVWSN